MKMITRVVGFEKIGERNRIANGRIHVNHSIEPASGSNPVIDCLARSFVHRTVIRVTAKRSDGCSVDAQFGSVRLVDELSVSVDQIRCNTLASAAANVVDAFEENQPTHAV